MMTGGEGDSGSVGCGRYTLPAASKANGSSEAKELEGNQEKTKDSHSSSERVVGA